jgi:hypothetical protein
LAKQFIDGEASVIRNNTSLINGSEIKFISFLNKKYSIGEYFVLHKNDAYILGTEEFNDFFIHQRITNHAKAKIYRKNESFICQTSQIKVLVNTLEAKIRRPTLLSFNCSTVLVNNIKKFISSSTHTLITTLDDELVIGCLDLREPDKQYELLHTRVKTSYSFEKLFNTSTLLKILVQDDYLVSITNGDFLAFEAMKNQHTVYLQEQSID